MERACGYPDRIAKGASLIAQHMKLHDRQRIWCILLFLIALIVLSSCVEARPLPETPAPAATIVLPTLIPSTATSIQTGTTNATPIQPSISRPLPTALPINLPAAERRQIFESVWLTVQENYLYPDFHGLDWDSIHDEYVGRIEAAPTREQFYATLSEMVRQLDDQHSRFVAPSLVPAEDASATGRELTVGIGIVTRFRHDGAFIQIVFPNSPAARAGIRTRDRIIGVDGRPYRLQDGDLEGTSGTQVRLTVVRPGEKARDIVLERQEVLSQIGPYARRFPSDIGYVAIPTLWARDMGEQVSGALTDLRAAGPLRGIVLDVRSNRGGWGEVLNEVLSHFVRGQMGTFYGRDHNRPLVIEPPAGPDLRQVPLVVLIDGETASYAELLAAVLQHEADAVVVGSRSAGNTETIYAHTFDDGSRLWLAQEGFRLRDGTILEDIGILPDIAIELDWTRYSEDDDPQLLEALRILGGGPK
jgi:carboxyl-terminal processing protease